MCVCVCVCVCVSVREGEGEGEREGEREWEGESIVDMGVKQKIVRGFYSCYKCGQWFAEQ